MATDFLSAKFPPYVLTGDTTAVRYKKYYTKSDDTYQLVLDMSKYSNPSESGLYEFSNTHTEEFRYNVDSLQVNNVDTVCNNALEYLDKFPQSTLPSDSIYDDGIAGDTKFDEFVTTENLPDYGVSYSTMTAMDEIKQAIDLFTSSGDPTECIALFQAVVAKMVDTDVKKTYALSGYSSDNVRELLRAWCTVDYRQYRYIVETARVRFKSVKTFTDGWTKILEYMDRMARTMVDLARNICAIEIVDCKKLTAELIDLPLTTTVNGLNLIRVLFTSDLKNNRRYVLCTLSRVYEDGAWVYKPVYHDPIMVERTIIKFSTVTLFEKSVYGYRKSDFTRVPQSMFDTHQVWFIVEE